VFGFVNKRAALIGLVCLAAAFMAVPTQASPKHAISITSVNCTPSYTTVTCTFHTNAPTKASVATGTSKKVVIPTTSSTKATSHAITVRGLEPGFKYWAKVQAGSSSVWTGFTTLGPGTAAPPTVTTKGRRWLLNGGRFIPIVDKNSLWGPFRYGDVGCIQPDELASQLATGAKLVLVDKWYQNMPNCGASQDDQINLLHQVLAGQMWWNYFDSSPLAPEPSQPRLAEVLGWPPMELNDTDYVADPSASGAFAAWEASGFVVCHVTSSWYLYDWLRKAAREPQLAGMLLGRTFSFSGSPQRSCESPVRIANELWASVGLGAGVAWDEWANQGHKPAVFEPVPKLVAAAGKLSGRLAAIAPALLYGRRVSLKYLGKKPLGATFKPHSSGVTVGPIEPVRTAAWRYGGRIYLLAVNVGGVGKTYTQWNRDHPATIKVGLAGIKSGKVRGLWGSKGLSLHGAVATIHLPALGTGWYVITP
jgi:hypothetical protein